MLDQLVESKSNKRENRIGFLLTTFVLVVGLFFSAILFSLFAKDLGMGTDSLELSTLVAPIQATEADTPPEPLPKREKPQTSSAEKNRLPIRQTNMLRVDEPQIAPTGISVTPNTQTARPKGVFIISDEGDSDGFSASRTFNPGTGSNGIGIQDSLPTTVEEIKKIEPPPPLVKKAPVEEIKQKSITVSDGVVNGKAKYLPKPVYSAAAKAVRATGDVSVQVTIDEAGNVISAKALGGHPMLKNEAEKAALSAKFNPTLLSRQPVKVSGVIVYKFSM